MGDTVRDDLLRFADARWVGHLARGATYLLIGCIVQLVAAVGLNVVFMLAVPPRHATSVLTLVVTGAIVTQAVGVWMMTTPEPGAGLVVSRATARWAFVASAFHSVASTVLASLSAAQVARPPSGSTMLILNLLAGGLASAGIVALMIWGLRLARRLPTDRLAGRTRIVLYLAAPLLALTFVAQVAVALSLPILPRAPGSMAPTLMVVFGLLAMLSAVVLVAALVLLAMHRSAYRFEAKAAAAESTALPAE